MGSRLAKNALVAFTTFCVLAVPGTALAAHEKGQPQGRAKGKPSAAPTTEPQPKSHADLNKGGANNGGDCGAYCSTRDGSPSQNGKGDGVAKGKPCAGCVGKADNKNPPGQAPDGSDGNNGYECDANQGIGKTNPAHTGCTPAPTGSASPSVSSTTRTNTPVDTGSPGSPSVGTPGTPGDTVTIAPSVRGVRFERPAAAPAVVGTRLPTTGSNAAVALLLLVGLGLLTLGVSITVATSE